jgi:hypothetical protein
MLLNQTQKLATSQPWLLFFSSGKIFFKRKLDRRSKKKKKKKKKKARAPTRAPKKAGKKKKKKKKKKKVKMSTNSKMNLHRAARLGDLSALRGTIPSGALDELGSTGCTPLHMACANDQHAFAARLLGAFRFLFRRRASIHSKHPKIGSELLLYQTCSRSRFRVLSACLNFLK